MIASEYQRLAQRTSNTGKTIDKLTNGVLGLCGEAGEVSDIVKKYLYQGHPLDGVALIEELGDVCWYLAEVCQALHVSLDYVMEANIEKLRKRYPDGFEAEKSIHREGQK